STRIPDKIKPAATHFAIYTSLPVIEPYVHPINTIMLIKKLIPKSFLYSPLDKIIDDDNITAGCRYIPRLSSSITGIEGYHFSVKINSTKGFVKINCKPIINPEKKSKVFRVF